MTGAARIAGFGLVLAAVFGAAAAVGRAIGPDRVPAAEQAHAMEPTHPGHQEEAMAAGAGAAGLAVAEDDYRPVLQRPVARERRTARVDGYTVTVDGDLTAGSHSALRLTVRRQGEPVTDLQPYLGAYRHLVALREGDLAYLHVHPDGDAGDGHTPAGPEVGFTAEVPSPGTYHLFLDFRHQSVVRTAAFTLTASGSGVAHGAGHGH